MLLWQGVKGKVGIGILEMAKWQGKECGPKARVWAGRGQWIVLCSPIVFMLTHSKFNCCFLGRMTY